MKKHTSRKRQSAWTTPGQTPDPFQPRPFGPTPEAQTPEVQTPAPNGPISGSSFHTLSIQAPSSTSRQPIQPKFTIGTPGDKYEQEADRVANQVVQPIHAPSANQAHPSQAIQRLAMPDEDELQRSPSLQRNTLEEDELQMRPTPEAVAGGPASDSLESAISQARGSGQALDPNLKQQMGQAMGADFSGVTIHADSQADQLNRSIQAKAFTTGKDIFFRQGAYQPSSRDGQELIAHELTHVVQQSASVGYKLQRDLAKEITIAQTSELDAVVKIANKLAQIQWPNNNPPDLKFVPSEEITTTAFYDQNSHSISANRDQEDKEKLWDDILFEAHNALNSQRFKVVKKMGGGGSTATPQEYGQEKAKVEYDTFIKYAKSIQSCGLTDDELSPQAKKAIEILAKYDGMKEEDAIADFISTPHNANAIAGKGTLSSADLYAYELIEGWEKGQMISKMGTMLRQLINNKFGGPTTSEGQTFRKHYTDFSWPVEAAKRPKAYLDMIAELEAATQDQDILAVLKNAKLSNSATALAQQLYQV